MLILLTGHKRAGKDTCAKYLVATYYGMKTFSFADPMRQFVKNVFGWDDTWIEEHKEEIDPDWGISYRQVMQMLGTEFFQFYLSEKFPDYNQITNRTVWVKSCWKRMQPTLKRGEFAVVTDCRFKHEYEYLKQHCFYPFVVIRIERPSVHVEDQHASEQEYKEIPADFQIINDGTIKDLQMKIDNLVSAFL